VFVVPTVGSNVPTTGQEPAELEKGAKRAKIPLETWTHRQCREGSRSPRSYEVEDGKLQSRLHNEGDNSLK